MSLTRAGKKLVFWYYSNDFHAPKSAIMGFSLRNKIIYMCNMCHVYNFIHEELPVHVHGHAVLEVLLDPWVQSLQHYIIHYNVLLFFCGFGSLWILTRSNIWKKNLDWAPTFERKKRTQIISKKSLILYDFI